MERYKENDKFIVEIGEVHPGYFFVKLEDKVGHILDNKDILDKFKPTEDKIKFTPEMKKEFDELINSFTDDGYDLLDILLKVQKNPTKYPLIFNRAFKDGPINGTLFQANIGRVISYPNLLEVTKPEKHKAILGK